LAYANDFGAEAERINREILELDSTDTSAMTRVARCLRQRGADDEAIVMYTSVLVVQPDNYVAINGLAVLQPKQLIVKAKAGKRSHSPFAPKVGDINIPDDEAFRFANEIHTNRYGRHERGYKWALHVILSSVLRSDGRPEEEVARSLSKLFTASQPDWEDLGLAKLERAEAEVGLAHLTFHNAVANLSDAKFAFLQYNWIPAAVEMGMGASLVSELRDLTGDAPLPARVDRFRERFASLAEGARKWSGLVLKSNAQVSLGFTAMLLGAFDPKRYTFYRAGALKTGYELYAPGFKWPEGVSMGERYEEACEFVAAVRDALQAKGVLVRDLIDAQSFIWLRFRFGSILHGSSDDDGTDAEA
jgi:hypothetical protein